MNNFLPVVWPSIRWPSSLIHIRILKGERK